MLPEDRRLRRLRELAEQDEIYQIWKHGYDDCAKAFREFADSQPEEISNFLWGYAECGRIMQQRIVNLACDHMVFPESKEGAD